jgi:glutamine synthetase
MFESLGVMTRKELEARNEVKWETYTKKIQIEARVLGDLSMNHIIPVATRYQSQLLKNVENMTLVFGSDHAETLSGRNIKLIEEIAERTAAIEKGVEELVAARKEANRITDEHQKAIVYHDKVEPYLDTIRYQIDKLELIVDDRLWPLPKYRELLFIR